MATSVMTMMTDSAPNTDRSAAYFLFKEEGKVKRRVVLDRFPFTIGRARDCHLVVDAHAVSRLHARLEVMHEQIALVDLGSTNGTFVNDQRLEPNQPRRLHAGDTISFANAQTVEFDDPAATATMPQVDLPIPGLVLDEAAASVKIDGVRINPPLSPGQFALLQLLVARAGAVVSRDDIRAVVWGEEAEVSDQTFDALVSRLRKRLATFDETHDYIVTRRGFGLIFKNKV